MLANLHAIDRSDIIGYIIVNLCGLRIQAINRRLLIIRCRLQSGNIRLVCRRLRHGIIDINQCGVHARAIADCPSHLQRARFHISTRNRGPADGNHIFQLLAVIREVHGLLLQIGDLAIGNIQIRFVSFSTKRVIDICRVRFLCQFTCHRVLDD